MRAWTFAVALCPQLVALVARSAYSLAHRLACPTLGLIAFRSSALVICPVRVPVVQISVAMRVLKAVSLLVPHPTSILLLLLLHL
jgi:hypothetical protein